MTSRTLRTCSSPSPSRRAEARHRASAEAEALPAAHAHARPTAAVREKAPRAEACSVWRRVPSGRGLPEGCRISGRSCASAQTCRTWRSSSGAPDRSASECRATSDVWAWLGESRRGLIFKPRSFSPDSLGMSDGSFSQKKFSDRPYLYFLEFV